MKQRDPGHPSGTPWTHKCVHYPFPLGITLNGRVGVQINCGQPACRTVDEDGRQHFPDHAAVSARVWREAGGCEEVAHLIASDMDVHLLKGEGVEAFAMRPEAEALLLTGLAEVTANASMFGGIESTSFKIKYKNIEKRGRAIVKAIAGREGLPMAA